MTTSTDMEAEPKPPQICDSEGQSHPLGDSGSVSGASPCSADDEWSDLPPEIAELFRNTPPMAQEQLDRLAEANRKIFAEIAAEEAAKQNDKEQEQI